MESPDPSWLPEAPDLPWPPLVGSYLVCSALVGSGLVCSALVGSCLVCPTWTWPSVPFPGSTSAPPPSWIVLCVERLEAALWGGALSRIRLMILHPLTTRGHSLTTFSCTTLQLHITHGLHFPSTIALITQLSPITHYTNYTAALRHAHFISFGLHLSHCEVLFSPV